MISKLIASCLVIFLLSAAQSKLPSSNMRVVLMALEIERIDSYRRYEIGVGNHEIIINYSRDKSDSRRCKIKGRIDEMRLSFDKSAIIISENSYIPVELLESCLKSPINPLKTPSEEGILVDVNVAHKVYIALIPVTVQPMTYLASVGVIGGNKGIISLPGSYIGSHTTKQRQERAFAYVFDDSSEFSAKISPDGNYVAVSGDIDCSPNSYPGVWSLREKKKITIDEATFPKNWKCQSLFHHQ